ncbi:type II toxin-antitoxin system HicA family toxin [Carboxydothermus pertinax]|uniref:Type II toxin-antitoxin system HicA family toxin n=1 Tax=Carboxydothermus pertinax TaxID=870242 RepID=A0A1L8CWH9_9THEO|nr:type II toxin-antitoxin system HicA family toxin [Carboxydothermus pertinax]GAV23295.1 hypothetical protein cpu_18050 [Carboxydothermus pertinax]
MSKIKKRFQRILNNPTEAKWDQLKTILEHYGCYIVKGSKGSHWVVYHPEDMENNVTVPVHNNRVKAVYIRKLIQLLENIIDD